jgi:hypothetical protein
MFSCGACRVASSVKKNIANFAKQLPEKYLAAGQKKTT